MEGVRIRGFDVCCVYLVCVAVVAEVVISFVR